VSLVDENERDNNVTELHGEGHWRSLAAAAA